MDFGHHFGTLEGKVKSDGSVTANSVKSWSEVIPGRTRVRDMHRTTIALLTTVTEPDHSNGPAETLNRAGFVAGARGLIPSSSSNCRAIRKRYQEIRTARLAIRPYSAKSRRSTKRTCEARMPLTLQKYAMATV